MVAASLACAPNEDNNDFDPGPGGVFVSEVDAPIPNWFNKDPQQDQMEGVSSDRAYQDLALQVGVEPIIVAVIDSGVDVTHEDLQGKIWENPGETGLDANGNDKRTNGIDDDNNGYPDDVHGWNFLGNRQGDHLHDTTLEVTREAVRLENKAKTTILTAEETAYLEKLNTEINDTLDAAKKALADYVPLRDQLVDLYGSIKSSVEKDFEKLTLKDLEDAAVLPQFESARAEMVRLLKENKLQTTSRLLRRISYYQDQSTKYFNKAFDPRATIIGDDLSDFSDINYGNNDVTGPDASHGTHVAGIIAANRNNGIGINGVATDVRIMSLRAVPNGDEYDKDVANAVRYAVRNGARILNMSFGKNYSPEKSQLDLAFQEASDAGVLIVHSAGNDGKNNDKQPSFPNRYHRSAPQKAIATWLDIGASAFKKGPSLPAGFSNYGINTVDIFSPGVAIKSTIPTKNEYATYSGTSMASPVLSGVSALILAQRPHLTGQQLKTILLTTARKYPTLQVNLPFSGPGNVPQVLFDSLSSTGGVVDGLAALSRALQH